jgi:pilus assembly protein CpaF
MSPPLDIVPAAAAPARPEWQDQLAHAVARLVRERLQAEGGGEAPNRRRIARLASEALDQALLQGGIRLPLADQRLLVERLTEELELSVARPAKILAGDASGGTKNGDDQRQRQIERGETCRARIMPILMERMDVAVAARLLPAELEDQVSEMVAEIQSELRLQLNGAEQSQVVRLIVDDMLGLGPLEPLLADESVTDIMVNGPKQIYVERRGKLELTDITFRDNAHVMHVATRIVTRIGRRVDESSPLVDARLPDGSRVNIIIPPLAIDGPSISIRKFAKRQITLDTMVRQGNITDGLATVLKIASRCRLNILISGGTGSGKTTLLNAMSRMIDHGERIVTIEDAAELQLQQPHVVRLETRPPSIEGQGEVTIRDLVKNALRMRPDRIICGEVRGAEAIDMLQAMNTGHDGSMCTLHANTAREALTRLENMVAMSSMRLPSSAVRMQIASAVHLIVQISRMRDGVRRVSQVSEVIGMEGEIITLQDLFVYQYQGERPDGTLIGRHVCTGYRPAFVTRAEYYGLGDSLLEAMECKAA